MEVCETWDIDIPKMQYASLREAFETHFESKENIVATRHRFLRQKQQVGEPITKYIERSERVGKTSTSSSAFLTLHIFLCQVQRKR